MKVLRFVRLCLGVALMDVAMFILPSSERHEVAKFFGECWTPTGPTVPR